MKKITLLSCLLILFPFSSFASTINIPSDQPTIQAGINVATDGDTVLLTDGTYTGAGNYNVDLSGKSITVKSSGGADVCIVDCQQNGRGFLVYSGETVIFEGLTVKNGNGKSGGGIYINESEVNINNCTFDNNSAEEGGGIYSSFSYGYSPSPSYSSFTNCTFTSNSASLRGGAVFSIYSSYSDCTFTSNNSGEGGAIYSTYSSYTNCKFTSNSASSRGGAIFSNFSMMASSETICNSCTFESNAAHTSGGAVTSNGSYSSFTDCIFTSNSTTIVAIFLTTVQGGAVTANDSSFNNCTFNSNSSFSGGAVSSSDSSFNNCKFTSNSASSCGGAVNFSDSSFANCKFTSNTTSSDGGAVFSINSSCSSFTNCAFTLNEATNQGGAIWCNIPLSPEDPVTLNNCILWGNTAPEGAEIYENEKPLVITYSDIQDGQNNNWGRSRIKSISLQQLD